MDGSDSHGDGDTLAEHFRPDFKEYVLKEQLKWSLYNSRNFIGDMLVFWSEQDHVIEPSLSLDNCAGFNLNVCAIPKIRDNIRRALQKWMQSRPLIWASLFQFWAATKTLEGRTLLTTRYEPFALEAYDTSYRLPLCEYRMEMCRKYNNCFYADAESGEEQLGLPGRVFRNQFSESIPHVEYYTTREYPQRDLALRCNIVGSWAVPVFEHSSQTCVGVLEMVSLCHFYSVELDKKFLDDVNKNFQEFGLQVSNGRLACEEDFREKGKRVKGLAQAFKELNMALISVCKTHELPLAMTWVPCSACNGLRRHIVSSARGEFFLPRDLDLFDFLEVSKYRHLRKGLVAERARSSLNMLYCSDITQLSLHEYPLVYHARRCDLSGWFTICLLCEHTGNYIYVLEFFLSARSKDDEKTALSLILGTIEEKFTTFRFASGKELGELIRVEVIQFQENQKIHSFQSIQATRDFSMSSIPSSVQSSASVAYRGPGFQDASMGTINAKYDLNSDSSSDSDQSYEQSTTSVPMVTIKAKYASSTTIFKLSLPCRLVELQQKVAERLELKAGTYHVGYKDEEDEFVLIHFDEDLQAYVKDSLSHGNTSTVILLKSKEPATNLNPTN